MLGAFAEPDEGDIRSLTSGGRLVSCGATTGHDARIDLRYLFTRQIEIIGSTMGTRAEFDMAMDHVFAGKLRAIVDSEFALAAGAEAYKRLAGGAAAGKVLLRI